MVDGRHGTLQTREDILASLRELKAWLQTRYKVRSVSLFGSYARREQTAESDVDILVDVDPSIGLEFVDMADAIEQRLGIKADVVPIDALKLRYWSLIEKDIIHV